MSNTEKILLDLEIKKRSQEELDFYLEKYKNSKIDCNLIWYSYISDKKTKRFINEMYEHSKKYLDKNFLKKIQTEFLNRLFELYFTYLLINKGYTLEERKTEKGPDIKIKLNEKNNIWIEIVTSNDSDDGICKIDEGISDYKKDPRIERFSNSIKYKYEKYFIPGSKPFINIEEILEKDLFYIAIIPNFDSILTIEELEQILYGVGYYQTNKKGIWSREFVPEIKKGVSNSIIDMNLFQKYKRLAGVFIFDNSITSIIEERKLPNLFLGNDIEYDFSKLWFSTQTNDAQNNSSD